MSKVVRCGHVCTADHSGYVIGIMPCHETICPVCHEPIKTGQIRTHLEMCEKKSEAEIDALLAPVSIEALAVRALIGGEPLLQVQGLFPTTEQSRRQFEEDVAQRHK